MPTDTTTASEAIIACDPNAIPADMHERWLEVGAYMYAAIEEVQDLPDGYAFRLPNDAAMLLNVAEDINFERLCCPFMRFTIEIEPNRGPFWLRLTGGAGVKEYLRLAFEATNMLDEHVAKAAGFSISSRTDINSVETALEAVSLLNERIARAPSFRTPTEG